MFNFFSGNKSNDQKSMRIEGQQIQQQQQQRRNFFKFTLFVVDFFII